MLFIMNYMNIDALKKIGFNEKEIKIYIVLLRLGSSTATKIAEETNIDRATTYRFLYSLIEKGFVSYFVKDSVKYFTGAHPYKIIEDLKEKSNEVKLFLPELIGLMSVKKGETRLEVYKGKEGLKAIMKDILREKKDYTFIGEVERFYTDLPFYTEQWLKQVEKYNIKGRLIFNEKAKFTVAKTEKHKLISKKFISRISTWTYGNKTALFIWSNPPFGVVIDNGEVTKSNLSLFEFLWGLAKA